MYCAAQFYCLCAIPLAVGCLVGMPGMAGEPLPVGVETVAESVDDTAFIDMAVTARVTQRFEIYNPHSIEDLRTIQSLGFHQVILDWPNLHAAATALGLDVVLAQWWTPQNEVPAVENGVAHARQIDPRRLVAVSMMDEPERNSPDTPFSYYEALYLDLRARFDQELPGVKLEISHWGPLRCWAAERYESLIPLYRGTDRIRIMPYPDLDEGPLSEVFFQMLRSRYVMKLAGRELPQVVILQTWVLPDNPKLPTIDELRVMAFQALLTGAETISFFNYDPELWQKTAGFSAGFAELMRELADFSSRFRNATVQVRMNSAGVLTATLVSPESGSVTVLVNTNRHRSQGLEPLQVVVPSEQRIQPRGWRRARARWRHVRGR